MKKRKVVIVEDQQMPRQLFELYIKSSDCFETVVSFDRADLAVIYCLRNPVDLILMDVITRNHSSGLDAAARIKKNHPNIKIIIVTSMPEYSWIRKAKQIGVESFWYKEINEEPILSLMKRTINGEHIYPDSTPIVELGLCSSDEFTERELEVLREITCGSPNAEIAEHLHISVPTVKTHLQSLLDKTGFRNRTELAVKARESGLVIPDNR